MSKIAFHGNLRYRPHRPRLSFHLKRPNPEEPRESQQSHIHREKCKFSNASHFNTQNERSGIYPEKKEDELNNLRRHRCVLRGRDWIGLDWIDRATFDLFLFSDNTIPPNRLLSSYSLDGAKVSISQPEYPRPLLACSPVQGLSYA